MPIIYLLISIDEKAGEMVAFSQIFFQNLLEILVERFLGIAYK